MIAMTGKNQVLDSGVAIVVIGDIKASDQFLNENIEIDSSK